MILTITLNPSVDISYRVDKLNIDGVSRSLATEKVAGGKTLNVSKVLKELGQEVTATGFCGGYLGEFIKCEIEKLGIKENFYQIEGQTRNCIAILHENKQTEVLESGPEIGREESRGFLDSLDALIEDSNIVVMSGSLPKGLEKDYYTEIVKRVKAKGKKAIVDTSGESLKKVVEADVKPDFIKPNVDEISQLLGREIGSDEASLKKVLSSGNLGQIENILVSLGADGAVAKLRGNFYKLDIPNIHVVSPVGSGDSTVAGLAYGLEKNLGDEDLLKSAMTCGILNTMELKTGHINIENFDQYFEQVKVRRI